MIPAAFLALTLSI